MEVDYKKNKKVIQSFEVKVTQKLPVRINFSINSSKPRDFINNSYLKPFI